MDFPVDRRTAFGGLAGAALSYGLGTGNERQGIQPPPSQLSSRTMSPENMALARLGERPSVRDKGAKGDGVAMDGAAIQDALRTYDTVWVPPGVYMIDVPLTLPSYCVMAFASDAIFCPAHDGMTIFQTGEVSYASRVLAPRVHARGKRNVTAFDLQGFRHRAEIQHADILECTRGIVLRELCWDTILYMPWIRQTTSPIVIANGSNALDVIHPGVDGFDTGIVIEGGPRHSTTSVRISGGYVQNGRVGIMDRGAIGTIVDGTYFEGLREADVLLQHAMRTNISRTQHFGDVGKVAIRATGVDGLTVFDPLMSSGVRSTGLYDIDASSINVTRFETATAAGINRPLGNTGRSRNLVGEESGAFRPVFSGTGGPAIAYGRQEGRWRRSGDQVTIMVELTWSGAHAGGAMVLAGTPSVMLDGRTPIGALAPAVVQGVPSGAWSRLDGNGNIHLVVTENGQERPLQMTNAGMAAISLVCLL